MIADVIVAAAAGGASSADLLRSRRHRHPDPEFRDPFSDAFNDPRKLMALDHGIGCEGMFPVIDVDVRTADPDASDADENLSPARRGLGDVPELDRSRSDHDGLFHASVL
jgi:hypothetical protein